MQQRVVITGLAAVSSIGTGRQEFWESLLAGRSGISPIESFDTSRYSYHRGGEVKNFRAEDYLERIDAKCLGRASQFGIAAARLALADAGLNGDRPEPERIGVSMGTTSGEPILIEHFNDAHIAGELGRIGPEFIGLYPCHVIGAHIGSELGLAGVNLTIPCACAAGNYAIGYAFDALRSGRADLMLAGGSDAFSRITFTGFTRLGAVAPEICQPFDRNRKGMIPGEGAAVLVLEPLDRALARGARIYAEVGGYGLSCDAHHMTAAHPEGDGAARAMKQALRQGNLRKEDVNYISAHGTGTPTNDRLETIAVKRVFGDAAYRTPISSIKSMLGHTMGAASALEAVACALAVYHDRIPPTINLQEPDPECDLDYVPNRARDHRVEVAMNNAYAFGGNNSTLILRKYEAQ
jgi:3-oxoacyl-[acyl-carrier-protein] synthase II